MLAAMYGRISCVKKLVEIGANVRPETFLSCSTFSQSIRDFGLKIFWLLFIVNLQILMFDSVNRRTCLHYAAYYGHADCVQAILSAAQSSPVAVHWCVSLISFFSYSLRTF